MRRQVVSALTILVTRPVVSGVKRALRAAHRFRPLIYLSTQMLLLLGGALVIAEGGKVGFAIGASMVAAGASGLVAFGWILHSEGEGDRQRSFDAFGLVAAFPARSIQIKSEYESRLSTARKQIDIMGFGLNSLREDFLGQFRAWSDRAPVRVLLVDPDAPSRDHSFSSLRDAEESRRVGETRDEIVRFIADTRALWGDPAVRFSLRLARTLPSVNLFRIDSVAFWGPYLISTDSYGHTSRNLPTMIVRSPGYMYERLIEHFDQIWESDTFSRLP